MYQYPSCGGPMTCQKTAYSKEGMQNAIADDGLMTLPVSADCLVFPVVSLKYFDLEKSFPAYKIFFKVHSGGVREWPHSLEPVEDHLQECLRNMNKKVRHVDWQITSKQSYCIFNTCPLRCVTTNEFGSSGELYMNPVVLKEGESDLVELFFSGDEESKAPRGLLATFKLVGAAP